MFLLVVLIVALLFKGYQTEIPRRDEEDEIDLKSFDERGLR